MKPYRRPLLTTPTGLYDAIRNHGRVLAGKVSFGATMRNQEPDRNIQCSKASGTSPASANTDFTVQHTLGRVPVTLAGWDTTNGGVIYRSPVTPWTATTATFRSTTASAVYNLILI